MNTVNQPAGVPAPAAPTLPADDPLTLAIQRMNSRTPEEIQAARERILAASPSPRPLPEGKTLADVFEGQWPGDETDEEILEILERMS